MIPREKKNMSMQCSQPTVFPPSLVRLQCARQNNLESINIIFRLLTMFES